jgi:hypothetical protein
MEQIDDLIVQAVEAGKGNIDEIFSYVAPRYSKSNSTGFFFVVEKRFKSLKRKGVVVYDRDSKTWVAVNSLVTAIV